MLKEITEKDRFYYRLLEIRKEIDLLIADFRATMPEPDEREPDMVLTDARNGKPYKFRKLKGGE
jgi:hypothetical protein